MSKSVRMYPRTPQRRVGVEFPFTEERPTMGSKTGAAHRAIRELLAQFRPVERAAILLNLCSAEAEAEIETGVAS